MTSQPAVQIRPMHLDDILRESLNLFLNNFPLVIGAVLLANVPIFLWQLLTLLAPGQWDAPTRYSSARDLWTLSAMSVYLAREELDPKLLGGMAIGLFTSLIQSGAVTLAISRRYLGRSASVAQSVSQALSRFPALLVGNGIPALIVALASLLRSVPPIGSVLFFVLVAVLYPLWLFATPAIMNECLGGIGGLHRSVCLARKSYGRVLGNWLMIEFVLFLASVLPFFVFGLIAVGSTSATTLRIAELAISNLAAFVIGPFRDIAIILLYFEMRRRKEGAASLLRDRLSMD